MSRTRKGRSHFTPLFEALTLMGAPTMSVLAAGWVLPGRGPRLWRVIEHHVTQASMALDGVRRAQVQSEPEFQGTRWSVQKKPADRTVKQAQTMHWLQRSNLKTARALRIKEGLRTIDAKATTPEETKPLFKRWLNWASRCRLEPFTRLGSAISKHLPGVLNWLQAGKPDGRVEAMNCALQEAQARARGYRRVENFITKAHLVSYDRFWCMDACA